MIDMPKAIAVMIPQLLVAGEKRGGGEEDEGGGEGMPAIIAGGLSA